MSLKELPAWHTFCIASVSNEQQQMDCTLTWFVALHMCNARLLLDNVTHCQATSYCRIVP